MADSGAAVGTHPNTPVAGDTLAATLDRIDPTALDALLVEYRNKVLALAKPDNEPTLISIDEARLRLGVSRRTLYNRLDEGVIRSVYIGNRRLIARDEIDRAVTEGLVKSR